MLKFKSIQTQISIYMLACTLILSAVLVLSALSSSSHIESQTKEQAEALLVEMVKSSLTLEANKTSLLVQKYINSAIMKAESLSTSFAMIKSELESQKISAQESRRLISEILKRSTVQDSDYLGFAVGWKPNSLGNDTNFQNVNGSDSNGRFVPYWYREAGKINLTALKGYEDTTLNERGARVGEYYLCPTESGKNCVMNPFIYKINGKDTLMTTISVPIKHKGNIEGMVAIDISIADLNELAKTISSHIYSGHGEVYIFSQNHNIVGQSSRQTQSTDSNINRLLQRSSQSIELGEENIYVTSPISFQGVRSSWSTLIKVPNIYIHKDINTLIDDIKEQNGTARNNQILISAITFLLIAAISIYLSRNIANPIRQVVKLLAVISNGDLTQRLSLNTKDETKHLSDACNLFLDKTQPTISAVAGSSNTLISVAQQSLDSSTQTRVQMQKQQSALEQLATATEEMAATAQEVSSLANQASEKTTEGQEATQQSHDSVLALASITENLDKDITETTTVIEQLNDRANQVRTVLDVIQGIAEQTNLLALNAAIEAARAGEQGRGFAVVADEVRSLAQKTQDSTGEIEHIIQTLQANAQSAVAAMNTSQSTMQAGVTQVNETKSKLDTIYSAIEEIHQFNLQVATAAEEQSIVARDISSGVVQVTDVAQIVTQETQNTEKSSQELNQLAETLDGYVGQFKA